MREKKKRDVERKIMKPVWPRLIIWRAERKGNDRKISRWNFAECNCGLRVNPRCLLRCFYSDVLFTPRLRPLSAPVSARGLRSYARAYTRRRYLRRGTSSDESDRGS